MSEIKIIEQRIKEFEENLETLNPSDEKYSKELNRINNMKKNLAILKRREGEKKPDQQTPPKTSKKEKTKKKIKAKKEKRNEKLKKALEAGARVGERSISKISWDIAHNKIKVISGKLDYRSWQILNCATDKIAQTEWFSKVLFPEIIQTKNKKNESKMVIISAKEFKDYIGNQNISNNNLIKIFKDLPKATLDGETSIPFYFPKYEWVKIGFYTDNICGVALAHESTEFEKFRSKRKLRSKGSKEEEPVFILVFSNAYGQAFFHHSQKREACQLINQRLYKINSKAQELFQTIRWNEGSPIILNPEEISRAVGWSLPITNISARVKKCQRILDILYKENFINKPFPRGKSVEKRSWLFFLSKGRGVITPEHKLKFIKPAK